MTCLSAVKSYTYCTINMVHLITVLELGLFSKCGVTWPLFTQLQNVLIYNHRASFLSECGSTLYVGMVLNVSVFLYIGWNSIIRRKRAKEDYIEPNIEWSYCKLTLKASEHNWWEMTTLRNSRFSFSFSSSPAVTQERRELLKRFMYKTTKKFPTPSSRAVFLYRTVSQSDNIQHEVFRGSQRQSFAKSAMF